MERVQQEASQPRALLEQAVAEYPQFAAAWTFLGRVRRELRDAAGARDAIARSIEADPKYLEPYIEHANLTLAESEWKEAVTVAGQLINANPLFTLGYYYRGAALLRLGELRDAEEAAIKALNTLDAKVFPETHFLLGEVYAGQREYPLAAREYRYLSGRRPLRRVGQLRQRPPQRVGTSRNHRARKQEEAPGLALPGLRA